MKHFLSIVTLGILIFSASCKKKPTEVPCEEVPNPPVETDTLFSTAPYSTLSAYNFFDGELKDQTPKESVLPYEPISSLFTDYALKKRFMWLPEGKKATYDGDGKILSFPIGTALIKTFYYNNVQPGNTTQLIETRIMIRKQEGWIFAEYVWNDEQTEAHLDMAGSTKTISWMDENNNLQSADYRIPSDGECLVCHKSSEIPIPIGPKPQNLNWDYQYLEGAKNQLDKMIEVGYLETGIPTNILSTVDYKDESKSTDLRLRSYLDINCAHCHQAGSHCSYRPLRLAFSETSNKTNMGLCVPPDEFINANLTDIISPANINRSVMYYRLNSTDQAVRMPLTGRSIIHEEGVQLLEDWINENTECP